MRVITREQWRDTPKEKKLRKGNEYYIYENIPNIGPALIPVTIARTSIDRPKRADVVALRISLEEVLGVLMGLMDNGDCLESSVFAKDDPIYIRAMQALERTK